MVANNMMSETLIYFNILGGFIVGIVSFLAGIKYRGKFLSWLKFVYSFIGFYWCFFYEILLFIDVPQRGIFTAIFIRPSISLVITAIAIDTLSSKQKLYLPDLIKDLFYKVKGKLYGHS